MSEGELNQFDILDKFIKMELVRKSNRIILAWYVLTGRAITVSFTINPYIRTTEKPKQGKEE